MPSQDKVDEILSRFPGPVKLDRSPRKWIWVLLACSVFVAIGVGLMPKDEVETWFVIAFFGLGVLVAAAMLLPGAGGLVLSQHSFEMTSLFRRHSCRWQATSGFRVMQIPRAGGMVVFDDTDAKTSKMGRVNASLVGRSSALPETYGLSAEDLARLMEQWRERALR